MNEKTRNILTVIVGIILGTVCGYLFYSTYRIDLPLSVFIGLSVATVFSLTLYYISKGFDEKTRNILTVIIGIILGTICGYLFYSTYRIDLPLSVFIGLSVATVFSLTLYFVWKGTEDSSRNILIILAGVIIGAICGYIANTTYGLGILPSLVLAGVIAIFAPIIIYYVSKG
ncbi:MAG: hypothetical protein QXP42_01320 [Candidatus Micrarchaeia archaeon]